MTLPTGRRKIAVSVVVPRGGAHASGHRVGYVRPHPRHEDETGSPSDRPGCGRSGGRHSLYRPTRARRKMADA